MAFVTEGNGIEIIGDNFKINIDPKRKMLENDSFITHAHSDHAKIPITAQTKYFMHNATKNILSINPKINKELLKESNFNKKMKFDNFDVTLKNAGHILGSSQVEIDIDEKIVVTGDMKLQDSIIQKGAEIIPCDTLVIESTFASSEFSFQKRENVYLEMEKWTKKMINKNYKVILSGNTLGKSQELTKFSNEYLGIEPLVYEKVFSHNNSYKKSNKKLGNYIKLDNNYQESDILILPQNLCKRDILEIISHTIKKPIISSVATGWKYSRSFSKIFNLSDHADLNQLLEYIKQSSPKTVYTYHGFDENLAKEIQRKLKISAIPLKHASQKTLTSFIKNYSKKIKNSNTV